MSTAIKHRLLPGETVKHIRNRDTYLITESSGVITDTVVHGSELECLMFLRDRTRDPHEVRRWDA